MKLTDEKVARALGYGPGKHWRWVSPKGSPVWTKDTLPRFTTSLDCIVAEIEARGLVWHCDTTNNGPKDLKRAWAWLKKPLANHIHGEFAGAHGKTAPLALCAALLAYLKEPR